MFPKDELRALLAFLERVQLAGNESDTHVYLKNKIKQEINKPAVPTPAKAVLSPPQEKDMKPKKGGKGLTPEKAPK